MGKSRKAPLDAGAAQALIDRSPSSNGATVLRYECTLVTPMYGGGVEAGKVDKAMPIRATAIRGQLREWWRRLNHKNFANAEAMFVAEREIWGGLGGAETLATSKVKVRVESGQAGSLKPVGKYEKNKHGKDAFKFDKDLERASYALFPAAPNNEDLGIGELMPHDHVFTLLLSRGTGSAVLGDVEWQQVQDAVRWWSTFGGVGARTRRGCGAVQVKDAQGQMLSVSEKDAQDLGYQLVLGGPEGDALAAWKYAIEKLKDFRQKPGLARNPGKDFWPGRSRWPEPDAIRRITKENAELHAPDHAAGNVFPRAAFGLPIITHFKQEKKWLRKDPQDTTLKPHPKGADKPADRMASPLILRPYATGSKGWRAAALCLTLGHVKDMGLSLEGKANSLPKLLPAGAWQPTGDATSKITPLDGKASAIEAFLAYFGANSIPALGKAPAPARPSSTMGYAGVKLERTSNGGLKASNKQGKSWSAPADKAEELLQGLDESSRASIAAGRYVWCDIEVVGYDIIKLREKA